MKVKILLQIFLFLSILSCRGGSYENKFVTDSLKTEKQTSTSKEKTNYNSIDCYDYLTELIRSSNFPFSEWKIDPKKVNILIDEDNSDNISARLFFDTDGTGTIGWIEYDKESGKLLNTSANLDEPVELKYDKKWKTLFDSCQLKTTMKPNDKSLISNGFQSFYKECNELKLPLIYNFDLINNENGFIGISKDSYNIFLIENQDNYKIAKLPPINENVKPIVLITYNENGQSTWYLCTLNNQYKLIDKMVLYTSVELDNGKSKSTIFNISKSYQILIQESSSNKIIKTTNYKISKEGLFIK